MKRTFGAVYALVDWHNVQGFIEPRFASNPRLYLPGSIDRVQRMVAGFLRTMTSNFRRYRVITRIYHGWHESREPTQIRRDFDAMLQLEVGARRIDDVSFAAGFQFGNELCCDSSAVLFSTYRGKGQAIGQKMVDSAIVSDLLYLLHSESADVGIVISDDDDYVPALLSAKSFPGKAILLRRPHSGISHVTDLNCENDIGFWS